MSKKSIAVGVYNNPTIQQYLKEGILTSSQINKLIVEEIMSEDDLDEAAGMDTKNIAKIIEVSLNAITTAIGAFENAYIIKE